MVTLARRNSEELSPLREEGKLANFFRSLLVPRHADKAALPGSRVFGRQLADHLAATGEQVPRVVTLCTALVEERGIVDGIYRLSGINSNVQALRRAFDDERFPDVLSSQLVMKDIHSVSSLLKMYFRELPDPVCTFPLYDQFVAAVQSTDPGEEAERAGLLRAVLSLLPASNHRTLGCLLRHLHRVALHSDSTGMTAKNLAIVWAPNLLRCRALEDGGPGLLAGVGVQAAVTESFIKLCPTIFPEGEESEDGSDEGDDESGEEIDIAVFLHDLQQRESAVAPGTPACSPVVLRRQAPPLPRLSGGRGVSLRDALRRLASPVLLRRRHSDSGDSAAGTPVGTESPREEIIRRSLRLRDRIVSALSPQRLSTGSFRGGLEPRALSFTSIPDSSDPEQEPESFSGPAFGLPFIDASCEMLDSLGSEEELARRLVEGGGDLLLGEGVISIIGSSLEPSAASSRPGTRGSYDSSLWEPVPASLASSCDLRASLSPPPRSPPPAPLLFSSFTAEPVARSTLGLRLGAPNQWSQHPFPSLRPEETTPSLRSEDLTPSERSPSPGPVTPAWQRQRSKGPARQQPADPVMTNFPLFFENESKVKKKPKEKKRDRETEEYKRSAQDKERKVSGGSSLPRSPPRSPLKRERDIGETWERDKLRLSGRLTSPVSKEKSAPQERGAESPLDRRGAEPVNLESAPAPASSSPKWMPHVVTPPNTPEPASTPRAPAPPMGLVSLLSRRGRQALSPLRERRAAALSASPQYPPPEEGGRGSCEGERRCGSERVVRGVTTTEPAVIEVEEAEKASGVSYKLHHFSYTSKAPCGGER